MAKDTNVINNYETTVELPSKGLLYDNIPKEVTLRMITTAEEKFLYGSTSNAFTKVLKNCIVSPKEINIDELLPVDELFLIFQLRIHTYGPEYRIEGTCPHCGNKEVFTINLDEMPCYYLDDNFVEPIDIELPKCGSTVSIKLLRKKDYEAVNRQAKKLAKNTKANPRELEYILRMARYIKAIDGKEVDAIQAQSFVEKLTGYDSAKFWNDLDKLVKCGIDTVADVTCGACNENYELEYGISSEFFRPKFE